MNQSHLTRSPLPAIGLIQPGPIRLDLTTNPFGPSLSVYEALGDPRRWQEADQTAATQLRQDIARMIGVPPSWLLLGNGIDELLDAVYLSRRERGPVVLFPPSSPAQERRAQIHRVPVIPIQRTSAFALELDVETVSDLPSGSWAIVESPNDPTGSLLDAADAVRLSRATELLIIDERHGAYSGRSLAPLVREFENIVILQTMETWASLSSFPVAYAIGPPALLCRLNTFRAREEITAGGVIAATATVEDLTYMKATLHRVRHGRSRLYRMLRKLNMVSPCPSWANFLPVRIERGTASRIVDGLAERGIRVFQPAQPELRRLLRVSVGRPEETDALKVALIDIALDL